MRDKGFFKGSKRSDDLSILTFIIVVGDEEE
jgi:hypothetical protein